MLLFHTHYSGMGEVLCDFSTSVCFFLQNIVSLGIFFKGRIKFLPQKKSFVPIGLYFQFTNKISE